MKNSKFTIIVQLVLLIASLGVLFFRSLNAPNYSKVIESKSNTHISGGYVRYDKGDYSGINYDYADFSNAKYKAGSLSGIKFYPIIAPYFEKNYSLKQVDSLKVDNALKGNEYYVISKSSKIVNGVTSTAVEISHLRKTELKTLNLKAEKVVTTRKDLNALEIDSIVKLEKDDSITTVNKPNYVNSYDVRGQNVYRLLSETSVVDDLALIMVAITIIIAYMITCTTFANLSIESKLSQSFRLPLWIMIIIVGIANFESVQSNHNTEFLKFITQSTYGWSLALVIYDLCLVLSGRIALAGSDEEEALDD